MKYTEISQLGATELVKKRDSLTAELFQAKMKNSTGQLGNPVQIRFLRKDLARVETALSAKAAQGEVPTEVQAKPVKKVVPKAPAKKTAVKKKSAKGTK